MTGAADLMVMGAATVLLVAGSAKIVQPAPVAATLAELWQAIGGRPRGSGWQFSGRLLGVFEVVLACVIVIERSAAAALALLLFAVGLAVVGVVGIASTSKVSCACFGRSDRTLGWPQILQLPLWVAAAWGVAQDQSLFGEGTRPEVGLFMLACCAVLSTTLVVTRLWRKVHTIAFHRRTVFAHPFAARASDPEASVW